MPYFVYMLECADGSLYTGITTDVERRVEEHNGKQKGGAKYTAGRQPVTLKHTEKFASRSEATKRELEIKSLTKEEKQKLFE